MLKKLVLIAAGAALGAALVVVGFFGFLSIGQTWEMPIHRQTIPSGETISLVSFAMVWGSEHGERRPEQDCFQLEYVSAFSSPDAPELDAEARRVFELARGTSELWGFDHAVVSAFPAPFRRGRYNLFVFKRAADGTWSAERQTLNVFANGQ